MYKLYYLPGACSLAVHAVLLELGQAVELIHKHSVRDFAAINPVGSVPVLMDGDKVLREGAALMLYLLSQHDNRMLAARGVAREQAIEDLMFANASMHPAYAKLFFLRRHIADEAARVAGFKAATEHINQLWQAVDARLARQLYLGGDAPSAADVMLTVYASWGGHFPTDITLGASVERMIAAVRARPAFQQALAAEQAQAAAL